MCLIVFFVDVVVELCVLEKGIWVGESVVINDNCVLVLLIVVIKMIVISYYLVGY